MDSFSWIPALSTTGALAIALWLGRNLISTRLTKSVEHEFNEKLESLRGQMRDGEERLKAELRTREAEIAAIRGGALLALGSRQAVLDKRRLEAVDQLWAAVTALNPARAIATMMSVVDFERAAPLSESDPRYREFFAKIGSHFDETSLKSSDAAKARPFLSPMVWAVYSALSAVAMHGVLRWKMLAAGLGKKDFIDDAAVAKLIKFALPHYADHIDKFGPAAYFSALEALEARLLTELQNMLTGVDADKTTVQQAVEISRLSNEVLKQTNVAARAP